MKKSAASKIFDIFNIIFITLLCIIMLYPYLNQLAISFNEGYDTAFGGITIYPRKFTLINYKTIFNNKSIPQATLISVSITVLKVVISLIVTFAAAYALTRKNLKGRSAITKYLCIPMYLHAGLIPGYILYRYLGLINNYMVYIIPGIFAFYNMMIIRSFLQELPESLEESALLDGANELVILFKIIIPLSKPVLATIALWVAVSQWNDWTTALYYITDRKLHTLQYLMMKIIKQGESLKQMQILEGLNENSELIQQPIEESIKAAMLIVTTIPIISVYPFLQKHFVKGVMLGAIKG